MNIGNLTKQAQSEQLPLPYIDVFDRDISLGNGTQAITGIGFKPTCILFFSAIGNSDYASWGFDTLTQESGIQHFGDTDSFASFAGGGNSIQFSDSVSGFVITATITSMDSDGFTLTWTVVSGSPIGTARMTFVAFK